jgi:hypothetical protein
MKRREFITLVGGATLRPHFLEPTYVQSPKNGSVGCCGHAYQAGVYEALARVLRRDRARRAARVRACRAFVVASPTTPAAPLRCKTARRTLVADGTELLKGAHACPDAALPRPRSAGAAPLIGAVPGGRFAWFRVGSAPGAGVQSARDTEPRAVQFAFNVE